LTDQLFAVASDEDSVIRVYDRDRPGGPVRSIDLSAFLDLDPKQPESDLEGAARVGDRIYWISSHARKQSRPGARQSSNAFFATQIVTNAQTTELKMVGKPYEKLVARPYSRSEAEILQAGRGVQARAQGARALNIEGLSATPDGRLLIGFRNPIPGGKALLVPLLNPEEVVRGRPARFGEPSCWIWADNGIRDMAWWAASS